MKRKKELIIKLLYLLIWRPQGESNPCCQDENLESWATRRWGQNLFLLGGARRDRTADLNTASVALSQLSYGPKYINQDKVRPGWCGVFYPAPLLCQA